MKLFILLAIPLLLIGQAQRPKIGLALEGGGAKGLAHIGVLRWLEDHRIPVDYLAGTSMGGLIGGFYATGHSPSEIEEIVATLDWDQVLSGQIPYRDLAFRRKQDQEDYPNALVVGLRGGATLPAGLNSGHSVRIVMDRYTLAYSDRKSFDDLPIPFRCVATDLTTGKPKVFSDGPLPDALRATMSIPGVFAPLRTQGKVYVDGGLLDNLPTDVVKQMGADIVIGVHLNVGPTDPKSLRSLFGVMSSSSSVMIGANEFRGMELADILITVDVSGFTTLDFSRTKQIIPKGVEAAQAKANILSRISVSEAEWNDYLARRDSRRAKPVGPPQFIEVTGTEQHEADQIREKLAEHVGRPINSASLEKSLAELMSAGDFAGMDYSLTERNDAQGLLISAEEKIYSPPWLKPGFSLDGAQPDNVGFTFGARLTFTDVGGYRSELRTDLAFGSTYGARLEYYHPFTARTHWFIAPQTFARRTALNLYSANTLLAEYRLTRAGGSLDLGYQFDRFSELRLGYEAGYLRASRYTGSPILPEGSSRTGATHLTYVMDRRDNPVIPRSGTSVQGSAQWVDANLDARKNYPLTDATLEGFLPVSEPASIYAIASGGSNFGFKDTGFPAFSLGGPQRLAAYGLNQFLVDQYWYFRLGYLHRIATLPSFFASGVYLDAEYEIAKPYGLPNAPSHPQDGVVGVVINTVLGPMLIGGSAGGSGNRNWFFQLGRVF
jgi:NTE family protein